MDAENNLAEKNTEPTCEQRTGGHELGKDEQQFLQTQYNNQNINNDNQARMQNPGLYNMQSHIETLRKQYEAQRVPLMYNNNKNMTDSTGYGNNNQNQMFQNVVYSNVVQQNQRNIDEQNMLYMNNNYIMRMPITQASQETIIKEKDVNVTGPSPTNTMNQLGNQKTFSMPPRLMNTNNAQIHQNAQQMVISPNQMIQQNQFVQPVIQMPNLNQNYVEQNVLGHENMMYQQSGNIARTSSAMVSSSCDVNQPVANQQLPVIIQKSTPNNQFIYQVKSGEGVESTVGNVSTHQLPQQMTVTQETAPLNVMPQVIQHQQQQQQQAQTNVSFETLSLPNKINLIAGQINQLQSNINSINVNANQPQSVQLYQFLNTRLNSLKAVYLQLLQQQQFQQRALIMPVQQNAGVQQQMVSNPNAFGVYQSQLAYQNQNLVQNSQMMPRANLIQNQYQIRMQQQVPNAQMMMQQNYNRFPAQRTYMAGNQGMMMGQMQRMGNSFESMRGRRSGKLQRRRKKYSSESEEEEEITSSDVDSVSQLSPTATNFDDMELRRSTRRHTTKSYTQEFPEDSEEDKSKKDQDSTITNPQDLIPFQPNEQIEGKIMLIEKILADRVREAEESDDPLLSVNGVIEEFFVKFKYYSYLHCEWCNANELKKRDRNSHSKIKRYKIKKKESPFLFIDDDPYNPDYVEIDRILDCKRTTDPNNPRAQVNCYLVKWCALPYDESTWEFEDAVDEIAVKEYERRNMLPPPEMLQYKQKPNLYQWHKIEQTPIYKNGNILRDYQLEGINWLLYEYYCGTNCILADEMGLGKTVQSIAFLIELRKMGMRGPFLIIAPLSTIGNWYREFQNWSEFNVVVFHGAASSRNIIHRYELFYRNEKMEIIENICKFEVLITTYEMILAENDYLKKVNWRISIVDEAHRLKNRKCKLLENLSTIGIEHRVLLTGTPLQNTLEELLSLLHFLDPARADALENIMQQNSGRLESNIQVQQIQSFLKPVILRRLKEDVEKNIAPKEETIIEVEMTNIQKKVYRGILERNLSFLTKGSSASNVPNLMNIMMELRKCCNHPFLINGVEDKILAEYMSANPDIDRHTAFKKALIESSGKLVLVDKLLPKLKENGHKMLIFSQMVRVLDLIEEYLVAHNFLFERIDGSVRGNLRQAAIDRFSKPDSDRTVFLLCTKAGGLGINLTAADTVIIFDSDWNPQNDIQAQARCHRIGQIKSVKVYRLICRKTYEREMFDRASLKLGLDRAVLQDINASNAGDISGANKALGNSCTGGGMTQRAQLSKKEVEELLRRGAYAAVMDEDIDETAKFCSEDIEQILERRATVIQIAGEAKGSTFAKASFNANVNSEQVDVDDPDFWEKWAKTAKIKPMSKGHEFIIEDTPRIRKKIRNSFDDGDDEVDIGELLHERETTRRHKSSGVARSSWSKKECMKVEKNLLIYGWSRWNDILLNANFKSNVDINDIEQMSKSIVVICWQTCRKTDVTFSDFVEKAMRISNLKHRQSGELDSEDCNYKPYGKRTRNKKVKSHKKNEKICIMQVGADWKNCDIDTIIFDVNYKKHLIHNASKILIRLRMLFHIEYYILRNCKEDIFSGVCVDDILLQDITSITYNRNNINLPTWWDEMCDRSLIMGVYKHGYEKYDIMRTDKQLCFYKHIGNEVKNGEENVIKRRGRKKKIITTSVLSDDEEIDNDTSPMKGSESNQQNNSNINLSTTTLDGSEFPSTADLNIYIKRIVTTYWKNRMKSLGKNENKTTKGTNNTETRCKWTKKEELDFTKTITMYGIRKDSNGDIDWNTFRSYCEFSKKDNEMLNKYYETLIERCNNVIMSNNSSKNVLESTTIEKSTDSLLNFEKANKILKRVEFFSLINQALQLTDLQERIASAPNDSELPTWWNIKMDIELLKAISVYGLDASDKRIFLDKNYEFNSTITCLHEQIISKTSQETPQAIQEIKSINEMSVDLIKSIIHWPKMKTIMNRCYALSTLAVNGIYTEYDDYSTTLIQLQIGDNSAQPIVNNISASCGNHEILTND